MTAVSVSRLDVVFPAAPRGQVRGGLIVALFVGMSAGLLVGRVQAEPPQARAVGFEEKMIYHSPETPGHTAWVQLWREGENALMIQFSETRKPEGGRKKVEVDQESFLESGVPATYDFSGLVTEAVFMRSTDEAASWTEAGRAPSGGISNVTLPDGRLLALFWNDGRVMQSSDMGKNWTLVRTLLDPTHYANYPFSMKLLSDGKTLVMFTPYSQAYGPGTDLPTRTSKKAGVASWMPALFWSEDFGETIHGPIPIYPDISVSETDFCELPSGDLLFIHHRLFDGQAHRQLVRRTGFGLVPEQMEKVDNDAPEIFVRTPEGYLVGAGRNGRYMWSEDDGLHWRAVLDAEPCGYQPRAAALVDGRVLFCWHKGADNAYQEVDQHIGQHTFRLEVLQPRQRTKLRLGRVYDEEQKKHINAFTATLTTEDGTPIADRAVEFSIVGRWEPGYVDFRGPEPWVEGKRTIARTNTEGVARVDYAEQDAITDVHKSFQLCVRFDPEGEDPDYISTMSAVWEYYAVTIANK